MLFSSLLALQRQRLVLLAAALGIATGHAMATSPTDAIRQALQAGQLDQASKLVQQEKQASPRDPQIRFFEGVVLAQQGQTDKAIESFRKLIESNPEVVEAHNNLGVLYASKGWLEDARKALEAGMHANASVATLHRNLGDVQSQLAKQSYAKALQVDSKARSSAPQLSLLGSVEPLQAGQVPRSASAISTVAGLTPTTSTPAAATAGPASAAAHGSKPQVAKAEIPGPASASSAPSRAAPTPSPNVPAPAPSSASSPAPVVQPDRPQTATPSKPSHTETAETDAIRSAVMTWAKAWSRKDMEHYFDAYAASFVPSERLSRSKWEAERRLRILSKKSISVEVRQFKVTVEGKTATVQFQQIYSSDNFTGNSRKTLEMVKQGGHWLIARETVN